MAGDLRDIRCHIAHQTGLCAGDSDIEHGGAGFDHVSGEQTGHTRGHHHGITANVAALTRNTHPGPQAAIINPAMAGPTSRAALKLALFSATALTT